MWQLIAVPAAAIALYYYTRKPVSGKPNEPAPRSGPATPGTVINVPVVPVVIPDSPHAATVHVPPATVPATVDPVTKVVTIPETTIVGKPTLLNPGPEPVFKPTPAAGLAVTAAHRAGQSDLVRWAQKTGFQIPGDSAQYLSELGGVSYNAADVTGSTDKRTRSTVWLFQRYYNLIMQPGSFQGSGPSLVFVSNPITEDGLFGTQTYGALKTLV